MILHPGEPYDIALVGSGISSSLTLQHLLEQLITSHTAPQRMLNIIVIEKSNEFWKGIPYGSRSSVNSLTINPLKEFISPEEKCRFIHWLTDSRPVWQQHLEEKGGITSRQWLKSNAEKIDNNEWDDIYIPRFLYGKYVAGNVAALICRAQQLNIAKIALLKSEATDLQPNANGGYAITVTTRDNAPDLVHAAKAILATGSLCVKQLHYQETAQVNHQTLCINDLYSPALAMNTERVTHLLGNLEDATKRNILVIGSNASTMELLYLMKQCLANDPGIINRITVLSNSGALPALLKPCNNNPHILLHLEALKLTGDFTAADLMQAITKDIALAARKGFCTGDIHYNLSNLVVALLAMMSAEEEASFFNVYGMRLTKLTRRTGDDYFAAAESLKAVGKLQLVKGHFMELADNPDGDGCLVQFADAEGVAAWHPESYPVVINCGGSEVISASSSPLISRLVQSGLCSINESGKGFEVNENLEAAPGLYVIGPLLAGVFNSRARYWHVENAKRIDDLAKLLAEIIAPEMIATPQEPAVAAPKHEGVAAVA